jgi:predicted DsbA family dithiol-disulfide isomerase
MIILKLVIRIMKAYHEEQKAVEEIQILLDICGEFTALPLAKTKMFLEDTNLATEDVKAEAEENEGPQGVPFFIFGRKNQKRRKVVFSGFQTVESFVEAMNNLSRDA